MFCPKCGQSQVSEAVRFCSRCGLPLGGAASLLANDGVLPSQLAAPTGAASSISPRRKGLRQGGIVMLVGIFLGPMIAMMHPIIGLKGEYSIIGALVFMVGFLRFLYAAIFEDKAPAATSGASFDAQASTQDQFNPQAQRGALPPAEFRPAPSFFAPRNDTAEIAQPSSVTDHTTRLLQDDNATDR